MRLNIYHTKLNPTIYSLPGEKLLEAKRCGSSTFTVPYDRQALADFLGVDRSGLSAEIGRLQREGVLISRRRTFTLLPRPENNFSKK